MPAEFSKLPQQVISENATWLSIVSQLFTTRMNRLLKPHGLTLGQFSILLHVSRHRSKGGNRVSNIAAAVEVGQPAVTKALKKLQKMGLIDLSVGQSDKRAVLAHARPEASQRLQAIYKDIGPDLSAVFASLGETDATQFAVSLKQLGTWLDKNRLP